MQSLINLIWRRKPARGPFIIHDSNILREGFLAQIIDLLPGAIFIKDVQNDYRLCLVNREAEEFFSLSRDQMIGKRDADIFNQEEADFFRSIDKQVVESGTIMDVPCEQLTTPKGSLLLHTRKVPIYDEKGIPRYLLGLAQDITARVKNERELLDYKESLEKKVLERTQNLAEATQKAQEANRLKSEFLATMSHEIRSPMSGVLGMAELLLETQQTVEQNNLTKTIINCGEALLNVIEDILDFSKIEANRMEVNPVPVDMHALVDDVCTLYSSKAREKALELAVRYVPGTEQFVYADPVRVRQILSNLINNAIKFTHKGHIAVTVSQERQGSTEEEEVRLQFAIKDTGIGIPVEAYERIFEKFSQGDASTTRDYGGTGLGLSISRKLAEIMKGDIEVESEVGRGSVFTFSVPLSRNRHEIVRPAHPPLLKGVRVLTVDDLAIVRQLVEEQLSGAGMRVQTASGGKEALILMRKAQEEGDPYRIVIIDYLMPDMNGEMLARAINDEADLSSACLIMMTAAGNPIIGDDFARKGFSAYISKPLRHDLLLDMLAYVWKRYQEGKTDTLIRVDALTFNREGEQGREIEPTLNDVHILLAEDSRINQAFAQEVLENMGCRLTVATNGQEALDALSVHKDIALVLMDCQMPVMDGFEATQGIVAMKENGELARNLPIIALTANAMEGDRRRCLDAGMNDYLSKPVRRKELKEAVYRWVLSVPSAKSEENFKNAEDLIDRDMQHEAQSIFQEKYAQMVIYYQEDVTRYLQEIEAALDAGNIEGIIRPAHTIKSNSRSMGALKMSHLAHDLEVACRDVHERKQVLSVDALRSRLDSLRQVFLQTCVLMEESDSAAMHQV